MSNGHANPRYVVGQLISIKLLYRAMSHIIRLYGI